MGKGKDKGKGNRQEMPGHLDSQEMPGHLDSQKMPGHLDSQGMPGHLDSQEMVSFFPCLLCCLLASCVVTLPAGHQPRCGACHAVGTSWDGPIGRMRVWGCFQWQHLRYLQFRRHNAGQSGHLWPGHGRGGCEEEHQHLR